MLHGELVSKFVACDGWICNLSRSMGSVVCLFLRSRLDINCGKQRRLPLRSDVSVPLGGERTEGAFLHRDDVLSSFHICKEMNTRTKMLVFLELLYSELGEFRLHAQSLTSPWRFWATIVLTSVEFEGYNRLHCKRNYNKFMALSKSTITILGLYRSIEPC